MTFRPHKVTTQYNGLRMPLGNASLHRADMSCGLFSFGLDQSGLLVTACNTNALLKRYRSVLPVAALPELEDREPTTAGLTGLAVVYL